MDIDTPTKPSATEHSEDVKVDREIEAPASSAEASTEKTLLHKLDCTLLPLFAFAYLLAYMVSVFVQLSRSSR